MQNKKKKIHSLNEKRKQQFELKHSKIMTAVVNNQ